MKRNGLDEMPNMVWVDIDKLDLRAGAPVQMFDLESDFEANGEVSGRFQPAKPLAFQKAGTAVQWKPTPLGAAKASGL